MTDLLRDIRETQRAKKKIQWEQFREVALIVNFDTEHDIRYASV